MFSLCQSNCCKCREVGRKELNIFSLKVVGDKESDFFLSKSLFSVELLLNGCLKKYSVQYKSVCLVLVLMLEVLQISLGAKLGQC